MSVCFYINVPRIYFSGDRNRSIIKSKREFRLREENVRKEFVGDLLSRMCPSSLSCCYFYFYPRLFSFLAAFSCSIKADFEDWRKDTEARKESFP